MKHYLAALVLTLSLTACDDANKAIDQAQKVANDAVDTMQKHVENLDMSKLNLEQFGAAKDRAKEFALSIEQAVNADYSQPQILAEVEENIANTYSCLVDATSESTAEKWLNNILETLGSQEAQSVVEKAIEHANKAKQCVL